MNELQAETDLKKMEYEDFKENAELKAIIAGQKARRITVKVNDIDIAIRAAIPKGIRDKVVSIVTAYQNQDISAGDDNMYEAMAALCLEHPWNVPEVWKYLDAETGEAPNILKQFIEKIGRVEDTAATFRRK